MAGYSLKLRTPEQEFHTLDAQQEAAVDALVGGQTVSVVGGPGSGKTTCLIHAVRRLLERDDVLPDDILVVTPSRMGARRMELALSGLGGGVTVRTPSALAFAIVKEDAVINQKPRPVLIAGGEQDAEIKKVIDRYFSDPDIPKWERPEGWTQDVVSLWGFRHELFDLFMRCAEQGVSPDDLVELGRKYERPEWTASARVIEDYLKDRESNDPKTAGALRRFDSSLLVQEAHTIMHEHLNSGDGTQSMKYAWILVDDYQESTAGFARLLSKYQSNGTTLGFFGNPDECVNGFRGALPALVGRASAKRPTPTDDGRTPVGFDAQQIELTNEYRYGSDIHQAVNRVIERIRVSGVAGHRRSNCVVEDEDKNAVSIEIRASRADEIASIARRLRELHLSEKVPWANMAVITRTAADSDSMIRGLRLHEVPAAWDRTELNIAEAPAVQPFLLALQYVINPEDQIADDAVKLLTSPLGGTDMVGVRRIRRILKQEASPIDSEESQDEVFTGSDALLVEALRDPDHYPIPEGCDALKKVVAVLQAGREAFTHDATDIYRTLWAMWNTSGLAKMWKQAALNGIRQADEDLDGVVALFSYTRRYMERNPKNTAEQFLTDLRAQELPSDNIAPRAPVSKKVTVLTAASAQGREWDHVVVASVQDGIWPDMRLRDSFLGSLDLVDICTGRDSGGVRGEESRRAVLDDELRAFVVAMSRARLSVQVTAVLGEEDEPSVLFDLIRPEDDTSDLVPSTEEVRPFDLRAMVGELRAIATSGKKSPDVDAAKTLLAKLALKDVPGANPNTWAGLAPLSSEEPLWGADEKVSVSPSQVATLTTCPLKWALEAGGGTTGSGPQQQLGTLIHAIAQKLPAGDRNELESELKRRWPSLNQGKYWPGRALLRKADGMIDRLARYLENHPESLQVEVSFHVDGELEPRLGRAEIFGQIDRLEPAESPDAVLRVRIVDLKTSSKALSKKDAIVDPQLGAYQIAVESGSLQEKLKTSAQSAGAVLVYVGVKDKTDFVEIPQPPLNTADDPHWAAELISTAAEIMASSEFTARIDSDLCRMCQVKIICPLWPQGQQVTQ